MAQKVIVKTQTPSQRCEICHQGDCFDPINNFCTRCANLNISVQLDDALQQQAMLETANVPTPAEINKNLWKAILCFFMVVMQSSLHGIYGTGLRDPITIFVILLFFTMGSVFFLDWFKLRKNKPVLLQNHRNFIVNCLSLFVAAGCTAFQLVQGKINWSLSFIAIVYVIIGGTGYIRLYLDLLKEKNLKKKQISS